MVDVSTMGARACIQVEGVVARTEPLFGTHDWQDMETIGKVEDVKGSALVECHVGSLGAPNFGTAYYDDIEPKRVKPTP